MLKLALPKRKLPRNNELKLASYICTLLHIVLLNFERNCIGTNDFYLVFRFTFRLFQCWFNIAVQLVSYCQSDHPLMFVVRRRQGFRQLNPFDGE